MAEPTEVDRLAAKGIVWTYYNKDRPAKFDAYSNAMMSPSQKAHAWLEEMIRNAIADAREEGRQETELLRQQNAALLVQLREAMVVVKAAREYYTAYKNMWKSGSGAARATSRTNLLQAVHVCTLGEMVDIDTALPPDTVEIHQDGRVVGQITNLGEE